jgi:hypothetical protein
VPSTMIKPPDDLKTVGERRKWLERELPIPPEMKQSRAYRTLTDEAKIVLLLMIGKQRKGARYVCS